MTFLKKMFGVNNAECDSDSVDFNVIPEFEKNDLKGKDGKDGKSITITNSYINPDGNTVIKFSDGSSIIVNKGLKGDKGDKGDAGDKGEDITIDSSSSEVGPLGTTVQINFSDSTVLTFFIEKGEAGADGDNGVSVVNAVVDTVSLSPTYGHLILTLSNGSTIDAGYVLGGLTGTAGGELTGTYPNPDLVNDAVTGKVLTDLVFTSGAIITDTDSILIAFGKLQKQITNLGLSSLTNGSVLFATSNNLDQDNDNFFWDKSNKRLGVGTKTPTELLHLYKDNTVNLIALLENTKSSGKSGFKFSGLTTDVLLGQFTAGETGVGTINNSGFFIYAFDTKILSVYNNTTGLINAPNLASYKSNFVYSDSPLATVGKATGFIHRTDIGLDFIGADINSSYLIIPTSTTGTVVIPSNISTVDISNNRSNGSNLDLDFSTITTEGTTIVIRMGGLSSPNSYSITIINVTTSPVNGFTLNTNTNLGRTVIVKLINGVWQILSVY